MFFFKLLLAPLQSWALVCQRSSYRSLKKKRDLHLFCTCARDRERCYILSDFLLTLNLRKPCLILARLWNILAFWHVEVQGNQLGKIYLRVARAKVEISADFH